MHLNTFLTGMEINSIHFLLFGLVAILLSRTYEAVRPAAILSLNLYFLAHFVDSLLSAIVLSGIICLIYLVSVLRRQKISYFFNAAVVISLFWGMLFLIKDPSLFGQLNPFNSLTIKIVGLSYLVFRGISYIIESDQVRNPTFIGFLNYMLYFPMLLSGPIERYREFSKQIEHPETDPQIVWPSLQRIANGFIKKFVLADNLDPFNMVGVSQVQDASLALLWTAASIQLLLIYLDFSGYCDIMLGFARLMGVRLRENFNYPFLATNVQAFWDRWHMSLGQFLRDYVFNPLTKFVFQTFPRKYHSAMIVGIYCLSMLLIALWHGASYGFLIFGLVHASALLVYQVKERWRRTRKKSDKANGSNGIATYVVNILLMIATYFFVTITLLLWVNIDGSPLRIYERMLGAT
jgi:alginate O-acetyltransferase complex protein AlgI